MPADIQVAVASLEAAFSFFIKFFMRRAAWRL